MHSFGKSTVTIHKVLEESDALRHRCMPVDQLSEGLPFCFPFFLAGCESFDIHALRVTIAISAAVRPFGPRACSIDNLDWMCSLSVRSLSCRFHPSAILLRAQLTAPDHFRYWAFAHLCTQAALSQRIPCGIFHHIGRLRRRRTLTKTINIPGQPSHEKVVQKSR